MGSLLFPFLLIVVLFFLFLLVQGIVRPRRWCSLCLAVSGTWIMLLVLYYLNYFSDIILIALLMGQSILGIFYVWENKIPKGLLLFRLPFLLTLTTVGYFIIAPPKDIIIAGIFLSILWVLFGIAYAYTNNPALKKVTLHIINCCKRW